MRFAAPQRNKSALRADVCRSQPPFMLGKELRHQIQSQIVRADAENGAVNFSAAAVEVNLDLLARVQALRAAGD